MFLFISINSFSQGEYNKALTSMTKMEDPSERDSLFVVLKCINIAATKKFSTNYQLIMVERDNQTKAFFEFINTYNPDSKYVAIYDFAQEKNKRNNTMLDCDWIMTMQFIFKNIKTNK